MREKLEKLRASAVVEIQKITDLRSIEINEKLSTEWLDVTLIHLPHYQLLFFLLVPILLNPLTSNSIYPLFYQNSSILNHQVFSNLLFFGFPPLRSHAIFRVFHAYKY